VKEKSIVLEVIVINAIENIVFEKGSRKMLKCREFQIAHRHKLKKYNF